MLHKLSCLAAFSFLFACGTETTDSPNDFENPDDVEEEALRVTEQRSFDFVDSSNRLAAGRLTLQGTSPRFAGTLANSPGLKVKAVFAGSKAVLTFSATGRATIVLTGDVSATGSISGSNWNARRMFQRTGNLSPVQNNFYLSNGTVSTGASVFGQFFRYGQLSADVFGTYVSDLGESCAIYENDMLVLNQRPPFSNFNSDYVEALAGDAIQLKLASGEVFGTAVPTEDDPFFYNADTATEINPLVGKTADIPGSSDYPRLDNVKLARENAQRVVRPAERPKSDTVFPTTGGGNSVMTLWIEWKRGTSTYAAFCGGKDTGSYQINAEAQSLIRAKGLDEADAQVTTYLIGRFSPASTVTTLGDAIFTSDTQEFNFMVYPGFDPAVDPNAPTALSRAARLALISKRGLLK
jgi:hypothetical protein